MSAPDPAPKTPSTAAEQFPGGAAEPGLLERILPLLDAFEKDLLWAQSRAGQELFHSNTIAWLLRKFPVPCAPLLDLLGAAHYEGVGRVDVWRERRHLDIVIDPVGASPKVVIENKLYSVPYPAQLSKYNLYPLPWSPHHGEGGAHATRYVLLSLMTPSFPLPSPWVHVDYRALAGALDQIDTDALGRTSDQLIRYRALIHRLVALAEAVDPAQALDEPFSAADAVAQLPGGGLDGAIARMRFSGLTQVVQTHFDEAKSFEVGGDRGGIITYWRQTGRHAPHRMAVPGEPTPVLRHRRGPRPPGQGPARRAGEDRRGRARRLLRSHRRRSHPRVRLEDKELRSRRVARFQPGLRLPAPSS